VASAILLHIAACGFPRPIELASDAGAQGTADGGTADGTTPLCGNSRIDPGEECDDGNIADDGNGCDGQCRKNAVCGDSKVQSLFEICDGSAGCSADCKQLTVSSMATSDRFGRYNETTGPWELSPPGQVTGVAAWISPADGGPFEY